MTTQENQTTEAGKPAAETVTERIERCVAILSPVVGCNWPQAQALIELTEYARAAVPKAGGPAA